jgi:hypothetical protein
VLPLRYNCCINEKTQVAFACKFGGIIPLLFVIMIVMGVCWFGALMIDAFANPKYNGATLGILLAETVVIIVVFIAALPIWIQSWNANNNYGPEIPAAITRKRTEKKLKALAEKGKGQ